jgi:hypothetical protein
MLPRIRERIPRTRVEPIAAPVSSCHVSRYLSPSLNAVGEVDQNNTARMANR